jgi:hypothetical protein
MSPPVTHAVSRRCTHVRDGYSPTSLRAGTNHCTRCYPQVPDLWENVSVPNESLSPTSNTSSMDAEAGSEKSSEAGSSCVTGDAASSEDDNLSLVTTSSSDGSTSSTSAGQDSVTSTPEDESLPVTHARSLRRVPESLDLGDAQKSEYHDAETMGGVFTPEPRTPRSPGEWSWYTGTFTDDPDDAVTKAFKEGYKSKDKKK